MNLRSFRLYRDYSYLLTSSNVGEPSWIWISFKRPYSSSESEIKFRYYLFPFSIKRRKQTFSRRGRVKNGKEMYKKAWYTNKVVVLLTFNLLFFRRSRCGRVVESLSPYCQRTAPFPLPLTHTDVSPKKHVLYFTTYLERFRGCMPPDFSKPSLCTPLPTCRIRNHLQQRKGVENTTVTTECCCNNYFPLKTIETKHKRKK